MVVKRVVLICLGLGCGLPAGAQTAAGPGALLTTVQALDAKLFGAYNRCDLATLGAMASEDLEFCHDLTGLAVDRAPFLAAIRENICGKVERELLP